MSIRRLYLNWRDGSADEHHRYVALINEALPVQPSEDYVRLDQAEVSRKREKMQANKWAEKNPTGRVGCLVHGCPQCTLCIGMYAAPE